MKKLLSIMLLLIAAVLFSCGDKEVTDYYELDYRPEHSYLSGGMDANLSIQERGFNELGYSENEAVALMEQEFAEELAEVASITNENEYSEYVTQEQVDMIVDDIKSEAAMWKRWLICVTHPSKEDPKDAVEKIKKAIRKLFRKENIWMGTSKLR